MKIAFFSTKSYEKIYFDRFNTQHKLTYFDAALNETTANLSAGFEAICAFVNDKLDKKTLDILAKNEVKVILLRSAGYNNVDMPAASARGIKVFRVPSYSPQAVAEHALALILTLNRKTHKAYNRVREFNFSLEHLVGFNLHGKTVGVIGTGNIGSAFCQIMLGLGCKVLACDIVENQALIEKGVAFCSLDELLAQSDIISLHCPLYGQTQHLINENTIAKMKDGVMLINTSRGGLLDSKAAIQALKVGKIGYLGIDVYEQEAGIFFKDDSENVMQDDVIARLMSFPNVLITGHQAFLTDEALGQIAQITLQNCSDFEAGKKTENEVLVY
jgi:D-lactate dehydrogenase